MDNSEDRWLKLETVLRKVLREELGALEKRLQAEIEKQISSIGKRPKVGFESGKWSGITEDLMAMWSSAYPAVNIRDELNKAAAWLASNPKQNPKNQFGRFLNAWLARSQNQSSIRSIPMKSDPVPSVCAYCSSPASGSTGGYKHCSSRECFDKAMGGERPRKTA